MEVRPEHRVIFCEEARENLQAWEQALLSLEKSPSSQELINELFRNIHTLKGSAGFIGIESLQKLAHDLESALQEVRDSSGVLTPPLLDMLFRGLDFARQTVEAFTSGQQCSGDAEGLLAELHDLQEKPKGAAAPAAGATTAALPQAAGSASSSSPRILQFEITVNASKQESFVRSFLLRTRLGKIGRIIGEEPTPEFLRDSPGKFVYMLSFETSASPEEMNRAFDIDQIEAKAIVASEAPEPAAAEQKSAETFKRAVHSDEVVRVSVEKLDTLLNLVGELVIQNSGFLSVAKQLEDQYGKTDHVVDLEEKTGNLATVTRDLQDTIMKVRMLPVGNVFSRFQRVVRDLAKDSGKEINLQLFGAETEIDKKVMDRIGEPLVHLVRNAVDHGIEEGDVRVAAGKAPVGLIRLGAFQDGDHVCLEVSDDGKGLDRSRILQKAMEKGLVSRAQAERLPEDQIMALIFLPGFSTATKVTDISGRGVGMDVVKRTIEGMGGVVRVRSVPGRGTTVTISLPLTMAIITAMLAEANQSVFAIPLSAVREVLKVDERTLRSVGSRKVVQLRESVLSMVHLREALGLGANGDGDGVRAEGRTPVVIIDYEDKSIGLGVDKIIGTGEIVIKSLSRHYREVEGLIGASILGNGRIALIVDVEAMIRRYFRGDGEGEARGQWSAAEWHEPEQTAAAGQIAGPPAERGEAEQTAPARGSEAALDGNAERAVPPRGQEPAPQPPRDESAQVHELFRTLRQTVQRRLGDIQNEGAIMASMALSQLTSQEMMVSFPETRLVKLGDVAEVLGGEESPVGGLYIGLNGGLNGALLVVMPISKLLLLHDFLYHREAGSTKDLDGVDWSGISELGNILSASFINALGNATGLVLKCETPEITIDMCLPVVDSVLARFNQPGEEILMTDTVISGDENQGAVCHLMLIFELSSLALLTKTLESSKE